MSYINFYNHCHDEMVQVGCREALQTKPCRQCGVNVKPYKSVLALKKRQPDQRRHKDSQL